MFSHHSENSLNLRRTMLDSRLEEWVEWVL